MLTHVLAAEGAAHAEHAEVLDTLNWIPGVTALVVFGIAFFILYKKVWPPIVQGLDDRQAKIRDEIAAAEKARHDAERAMAEYQESLASARKEATEMIAKARADAKAVADDLRSRNEAELMEMKDRATRDIDAARRAAVAELHRESASLAASIAGKILRREISSDDQRRLVEESLDELANTSRV